MCAVRTRWSCLLMVPKRARSENFPFVGTKVEKQSVCFLSLGMGNLNALSSVTCIVGDTRGWSVGGMILTGET